MTPARRKPVRPDSHCVATGYRCNSRREARPLGDRIQPRETTRALAFKQPRTTVDKRVVSSEEIVPRAPDLAGDRPAAFSGLATQLIVFVFASTFVTATLVSWISIQSASGSLRTMIERMYPLSLEHAAQRIEPWVDRIRLHLEHEAHHRASDAQSPATAEDGRWLDGLAIYDSGVRQHAWGSVPEEANAALRAADRVAAIRLESGAWALAVAPQRQSEGPELVGVVSLARLVPLLELGLPTEDALLALVDGEGRVLMSAGKPPSRAPIDQIAVQALLSRGALRETELAGEHVIGAARPVALLDWHLAILTPFDAAYAPVLSVVTRVLLIDLCIILVFSFLAYHITARVVRPIGHLSDAARRLSLGESDFEIPERSSRDEIGLLTRTFNDMIRKQRRHQQENEEAHRHLKDQNDRLQQANEVLNQLSITDGLTKLNNHRFFQDHLTREIRRVERTAEPLSILIIDIDDFKRLNDRLGHAAGDEVLMRIAEILTGAVRISDLCARYGGDEFVILAPNTNAQGAYALAEKVRTSIAESSFIVDDSLRPLRATISIGVATFCGNRKRFFQKADQALYRAKADGKNCVVVHEDDLPQDDGAPTA